MAHVDDKDDSEVEDISAAEALQMNSPEDVHLAMLRIWDRCLLEGESSAQKQYSVMSDATNASRGVVRKVHSESEAMMLAVNDECEALQKRHAKRLKKYQEVHETLKAHVGAVWKDFANWDPFAGPVTPDTSGAVQDEALARSNLFSNAFREAKKVVMAIEDVSREAFSGTLDDASSQDRGAWAVRHHCLSGHAESLNKRIREVELGMSEAHGNRQTEDVLLMMAKSVCTDASGVKLAYKEVAEKAILEVDRTITVRDPPMSEMPYEEIESPIEDASGDIRVTKNEPLEVVPEEAVKTPEELEAERADKDVFVMRLIEESERAKRKAEETRKKKEAEDAVAAQKKGAEETAAKREEVVATLMAEEKVLQEKMKSLGVLQRTQAELQLKGLRKRRLAAQHGLQEVKLEVAGEVEVIQFGSSGPRSGPALLEAERKQAEWKEAADRLHLKKKEDEDRKAASSSASGRRNQSNEAANRDYEKRRSEKAAGVVQAKVEVDGVEIPTTPGSAEYDRFWQIKHRALSDPRPGAVWTVHRSFD